MFLQISSVPKSFLPFCVANVDPNFHPFTSFSFQNTTFNPTSSSFILSSPVQSTRILKSLHCFVVSRKSKSDSPSEPEPNSNPKTKPKKRNRRLKTEVPQDNENQVFPEIIPRKPRRGRRSEAAAVEDFIRDSLGRTFASIQQQNSESFENKENIMKDRVDEKIDAESREDDNDENENENEDDVDGGRGKKMNVVGEEGVEIDWEGEIDDNWVKEINCLEWESFAFHPSPLIVLVFERYNRAIDNWKALKELEKALKVYWSAKDRLPPRSVKIDINIERDLAYALKVRECPQILFLRGNKILYKEKEIRTADELVHMIAHFYYNAKRPSWIDITD
uniref:Thioredoxin domain-containing protein n=1 Tax=Fagus sylvatica TaxID=28930 RepID=A0A2N9FC23_FAGSY